MSDEEKKKKAEEDEETEEKEDETEETIQPFNTQNTIAPEVLKKRKLALKDVLKEIYKGKVNLGSAGSLKFDVDPIGDEKSASVKYTIPLGGRRKR
tara:strand:+ start:587 stop:874 length:288 start_codon:yes stop_codon:yes gene_type:complete